MTYRSAPFFPHRRNPDGTFNSICLSCLETIAAHKTEEELKDLDKQHVCNATSLSERSSSHPGAEL
jgi:hypothetical protein